ncbi:MAG: hypothetical protein K6E32_08800 [Lachnospiraceae bacterium]|nr:hypothetical protein [Lachnospiraceae bacterium]
MKKILSVVLTLALALSLAACGDSDKKSEGVMTYAEYNAAALESQVTVETYVQANQSWWDNKITLYTQDKEGGYFIYNMACSEADSKKLTPGTKIRVTGTKSEWSGEVEIIDVTKFDILSGNYVAPATDVTSKLGTDELVNFQNRFVSFKGLTVAARPDGNAFQYKYDGSGSHDENSDLYFDVTYNGQTYTFTVESYLCGNDTDVYKAVEGLKVGDTVDLEGFLYWYEGANPHITKVVVK